MQKFPQKQILVEKPSQKDPRLQLETEAKPINLYENSFKQTALTIRNIDAPKFTHERADSSQRFQQRREKQNSRGGVIRLNLDELSKNVEKQVRSSVEKQKFVFSQKGNKENIRMLGNKGPLRVPPREDKQVNFKNSLLQNKSIFKKEQQISDEYF